jgi:ABC-type lipoprotein release transport system permease subunit
MLFILAWRNLWRNRSRTLITMASVWCAVVLASFSMSLQQGAFDNLIANVVSFYSGYLQVQHAAYWEEQTLENSFEGEGRLSDRLRQLPGISAVAPRIQAFALASGGEKTKGCLVAGIDPQAEDRVTHLQRKLSAGRYLREGEEAVMVAEGLARRLKIGPNDTLVLLGQGYYGSTAAGKYPVSGIASFGSPELNERAVFMPVDAARRWLDAEGMATALVLLPELPEQTEQLAADLKKSLPPDLRAITWKEMMPDITEHIETDTASSRIMLGVLYLLITFGIFSTLLMMMAERRREFGMLIALGMKKWQLGTVVLYESILITVTGCLVGILAGLPLIWWFALHPIKLKGDGAAAFSRFGFEPVIPASTDPWILAEQAVIVLFIGLLLSLYPLYKVMRMDPIAAMRS